ncbi:hypothetical protein BKZ64_002694, partial [Escherichia coli]|nr:hypothetical protein [Escherichia coli]HCP7876186.1 hypothetical protein [Escherichia coli]
YPKVIFTISDNYLNPLVLIAMVLSFSSVVLLFIKYLNKDIGNDHSKKETAQNYAIELKKELERINGRLEAIDRPIAGKSSDIILSDAERADFIERAKKKIAGEMIINASESLKKEMQHIKEQLSINEHYEDMVYRIKKEIDRLNRRGGANLGIGASIAFFGIAYLGYVVSKQTVTTDVINYLIHMLPRISFVLVIEVFAYFFLKLYKNGFDEVKYFQNELTNIEAKVLAIKFLKDVKNEDLMAEVIKNLMTTERNFILSKGQTTVALEKEKIKGLEDKNALSIIKELIKLKS